MTTLLKRLVPVRPSAATLIASGFVILGFALSSIAWGYLAISAVAMFLPGILRELGWLKDKDEFQLEAVRRAGYHAYLAGGLFAFLMAIWYRAGDVPAQFPGALLENTLIVMWFTWLLSSLFSFWGPVKTARRILFIFGCVWLVFNLLGGGGFMTTLMQSLLAAPFFLLWWVGGRWPRVAGVILLGAAVFFFNLFDLYEVFQVDPTHKGRIPVIVLFVGPLVAGGLALLKGGGKTSEDGGDLDDDLAVEEGLVS
jgi:hypothetical protein